MQKAPFPYDGSVQARRKHSGKGAAMGTKTQSLAQTKWLCKYHIVCTPKYRRKIIFAQLRKNIGEILRQLCSIKVLRFWKDI